MDFEFHPGVNGSKPYVDFYPYSPSDTAGYAFVGIFGVATVTHIVLMFPYRAAYFIPLVIGGFLELIGYWGRAKSHDNINAIGPWAMQQIPTLCAPPFVAATIYMVLGRMIRAFDAEHLSSIRTKRLTAIFVINDVLCFLTQIFGAGVQVTGDEHLMAIGMKVVLAGLIFTLVVFLFFVWIAVAFHKRLSANPTIVIHQNPGLAWERYMWALYVSCGTLMIRNLMRTIEFGASGSDLNKKEVYIYVFDAVMMVISMAVLIFWHPGLLIKRVRVLGKADELYGPLAAANSVEEREDGVPLRGWQGERV